MPVHGNDYNYYNSNEIIDKIKDVLKYNPNIFDKFSDNHKKIARILNEIDPKIPDKVPWIYYDNMNMGNFHFLFK